MGPRTATRRDPNFQGFGRFLHRLNRRVLTSAPLKPVPLPRAHPAHPCRDQDEGARQVDDPVLRSRVIPATRRMASGEGSATRSCATPSPWTSRPSRDRASAELAARFDLVMGFTPELTEWTRRMTLILAHVTLPTRDVERTAAFLEQAFGLTRVPVPDNSPVDVVVARHRQRPADPRVSCRGLRGVSLRRRVRPAHRALSSRPRFRRPEASAHRAGRDADRARARPRRTNAFFFREPVNGYVFEVIDDAARL